MTTARRTQLQLGGWWLLAVVLGVGCALTTWLSFRLGCTVALVGLAVGAYVRSRAAGLMVLTLVWLLAAFVRRLFNLSGGAVNADPLALAPFLITALLVLVELRRGRLDTGAGRLAAAAGAGFAFGIPLGASDPQAMAFALLAYVSGVGAFVLGRADPAADGGGTVLRVLLALAPLMAAYGILQYVDLPVWDATWLRETNLITATAPEAGKVRVWSTLNAPLTLGVTLGVALVGYLVSRRADPLRIVGAVAAIAALALTYVRSAWVALAVTLVALVVASRGRLSARVAVVVAVALVGVPVAVAGTPTGQALVSRFDTLGQLGDDTSAQERQASTLSLVPPALGRPLGTGLGSAGEASRLADAPGGDVRYTDNAFLGLLLQVGPVGFVLVIGAALAGLWRSWNLARRRGSDRTDLMLFGILVFLFVGLISGDLLYGFPGVVFWYVLGMAWRRAEGRLTAGG